MSDISTEPKAVSLANQRQVGGSHYSKHGSLQHWDIVAYFKLDYFQGQITKYVMRWRDKGGVEDLKKARHFLDKYIEVQERCGTGSAELDTTITKEPICQISTEELLTTIPT